jgi:integrase/recombinase XerD
MLIKQRVKRLQVRGHLPKVQSGTALTDVITQTLRLWRKAHLDYDQTRYVVEQVRRRLRLDPPRTRQRSIERLDRAEVERLIQRSYRAHSKYGLMIKTLFFTGTRVTCAACAHSPARLKPLSPTPHHGSAPSTAGRAK